MFRRRQPALAPGGQASCQVDDIGETELLQRRSSQGRAHPRSAEHDDAAIRVQGGVVARARWIGLELQQTTRHLYGTLDVLLQLDRLAHVLQGRTNGDSPANRTGAGHLESISTKGSACFLTFISVVNVAESRRSGERGSAAGIRA